MESTKSGGVIAYICSSSPTPIPESCLSDRSSSSCLSSSPPLAAMQSRRVDLLSSSAVAMPTHAQPRSHGSDKTRPAASTAKSGITKLNGMVLLCKVCGDVASGFHYGVHACEGCKGFFRRSIQQNIQYKKCLKTESCTIVRINRNRCQQCRFKKCLSVGMSRDSVRFGRIPKREKQRMLLEMQTAMNNMMNNSQLHHMLHGTQTSPCPDESIPNDSSSSPLSSPQSSQDLPKDSESVVAMDTSMSSASSCSSDSGEEDVIGSGTTAHKETFKYCHKRPVSSPAGGSLSPGLSERLSSSSMEDQQQSWNQRNNHAVVTGYHRHSPCGSSQHVTSGPFREEMLGHRTAQQLNSAPSGGYAIAAHSSYHNAHNRNTTAGGNRGHLVCPMNTSPLVDPCKPSHEIWEEFSRSFTPAVREVVDFAKRIPGFQVLSQHDQVSLLKAGTFEVLMVRFASLFNMKERTVTFLSGRKYSLEALRSMGAGELLISMFEFSAKLTALQLNKEEMSLFAAVVLVSADRSGIENVNSVEALQDSLIRALRSLIMKNHLSEAATVFTRLFLKLPDLHSLNKMHSEELLAFTVHP